MSIFEHNYRARIYNPGQHPYKHTLDDFAYANAALPNVTTLQSTIDWLVAVLYPRAQPSVATVADLPSVGNTHLDYRVVLDDGDGKAASYRWEQREGDATAKWYKIYDMDWGSGSVLSGFLDATQDLYVYKQGYDDRDSSGVVLAGVSAGQHIYGGASASTNLTLHANSGDGVGAQTGYVQTTDHFRPTANGTLDLGTSALKFRTGYFATSVLAGTMTLSGGTIADSSGAISMGALNVTTTGYFSGTSLKAGTMTLSGGTVADSSGSLTFGALNLATTGTLGAGVTTVTSLVVGTTTLSSHTVADTSGAFSFSALNVSTTGYFSGTTLKAGTMTLSGGTVADSSGALTFGALNLATTGTLAAGATTVTGALVATTVAGGNLKLTGNTLQSTDTNGNVALSPNGTGFITVSCLVKPTTDGARDLGAAALRWQNIYLSGSFGDGTNTMSITNLLTFRAVGTPNAGDALFWDGSKWVASAPDTEITHSTLSGLTSGDAGHTQFALLAGRSGGQSLVGGTATGENLTLESTAHATKGKILAKDTLAANADAVYSSGWTGADLGGASNRFRNLYTAGECIGLRLENLSSDPSSSSQRTGRLWWNTTSAYVGVDTGAALVRISLFRWESDTVWDGSTASKSVTVSGIDATKAIWQLKDNTNNYEVMDVKITSTGTTNVTITANISLPAGSYRLIGIQ